MKHLLENDITLTSEWVDRESSSVFWVNFPAAFLHRTLSLPANSLFPRGACVTFPLQTPQHSSCRTTPLPRDLILVQTWGILVKTFSKGTALCSILAARAVPELMVTSSSARSQEGNTWILHHCKKIQGPLTKKAPSRCCFGSKWHWWIVRKITFAFPCFVDSINVFQPKGTMNSSQDSWWIFIDIFNH